MGVLLTPKKRQQAIEEEYANIFAQQSNRIITNKVYNQLLKKRGEVDNLLKRVKDDIRQEEYAQHYQNLLNEYGKRDKIPAQRLLELKGQLNERLTGREKDKLLEDFKEAFKLATTIRQITTNEKIIFSVVQEVDGEDIGVVELNTDQMLERLELATVDFDNVRGNILAAIKTRQKRDISHGKILRRAYHSKQSNLYKSVASFFEIATKTFKHSLNKGTRWQLYYYFYEKYGRDDTKVITDTEQLLRGYFMAKAGYAWYKGGDVGRFQVKYGGETQASFTSFNSVVTILEKFKKIMDKCEKEKLGQGPQRTKALMDLFTVDKKKQIEDTKKRTKKAAKKKAVEKLDEQFKKELNRNGIKYE